MSFHPQQTLSLLGYLGSFYTICEWINIQGVETPSGKTSKRKVLPIGLFGKSQDFHLNALEDDPKSNQCF
jgi:hypothetical protein